MTSTTKVQKTSDIVFNELRKNGFSKFFNWIDYQYFKKLAEHEGRREQKEKAQAIIFYFLNYNNEPSDFADYEF